MGTTGFFFFFLCPAVLLFLMLAPLGRGTRVHSILIATSPKTLWDTHFFHVGRCNYRQLIRSDNAEVLSQAPLTVRLTGRSDLGSVKLVTVDEVFEPYRRYRVYVSEQGGAKVDEHDKVIEDGELQEEAGGTRLRFTMSFPRLGLILPWLARGHGREPAKSETGVRGRRAPENAEVARVDIRLRGGPGAGLAVAGDELKPTL